MAKFEFFTGFVLTYSECVQHLERTVGSAPEEEEPCLTILASMDSRPHIHGRTSFAVLPRWWRPCSPSRAPHPHVPRSRQGNPLAPIELLSGRRPRKAAGRRLNAVDGTRWMPGVGNANPCSEPRPVCISVVVGGFEVGPHDVGTLSGT